MLTLTEQPSTMLIVLVCFVRSEALRSVCLRKILQPI